MKMKMSLGEGGIKGFLARHVEKIVFGLAVLVVLWVALPDSKRKPIDNAQLGADTIKNTASIAGTRLQTETAWPLIKGERFKEADNYLERARRSLIRVEPSDYPADTPLSKPLFPLDVKRTDPEIYPLEKIEVAVSYGPVTVTDDPTGRPAIRRTETVAVDGRPLPAEVQQRLTKFGTPPSSGGKAEGKYIVSILGQIPLKKQIAEFRSRFKDAAGYNESRDFPNYGAGVETKYGKYYYAVERAVIAPDGTEGEWKLIGDSYRAREKETTWPAVAELADPLYVDPVWTMRLPPLMMRDLRPLALHSEVPSAAQTAAEAAEPEIVPEDDPMDDFDGPVLGDDEDDFAGPEAPRTPVIRPRGGEGWGSSTPGAQDAEFKLFRYIDMDVQPGKAYVYRVRLYIEDPNDPSPSSTAPKPALSALDKAVIERLARKPKKNEWWRLSPYSEVSQVVRVPATNQVLAGSILPKGSSDPNNPIGARLSEAMVNVMALVWDEKKAMDVPGTVLAGRGSVLNFKSTVEAIDVANSVLKKLPDYDFQTNNIVVDLRGGETFNRKSDLSTPGELLLIDDEGNLVVRKELEDQTAFAENTFPPEAKAAEAPLEGEPEKRPGTRTRRPTSGERGGGLLE